MTRSWFPALACCCALAWPAGAAQQALSDAQIDERFGWFLEAYRYGAPPHRGIAPGIDRIVMALTGTDIYRFLASDPETTLRSMETADALVGLHHCDKNGPGFSMALARLNYPGLIVSGGTILPGSHEGRDVTILDVYDSLAAASVGAGRPTESPANAG